MSASIFGIGESVDLYSKIIGWDDDNAKTLSQLKVGDTFFVVSTDIFKMTFEKFMVAKPFYNHNNKFYIKGIDTELGHLKTFKISDHSEYMSLKYTVVMNKEDYRKVIYIASNFESLQNHLMDLAKKNVEHCKLELNRAESSLKTSIEELTEITNMLNNHKE